MLSRYLVSFTVALCLCALSLLTVEVSGLQHRRDHHEIQIHDRGGWEEATLVDEETTETDFGTPLRWLTKKLRKRQVGVSGQGTGNTASTNGNNLTGVPSITGSGVAGQNNAGVIPGSVGNKPSGQRDQTNCYDVTTTRNNSCWKTLNVSNFVRTWANNTVCGQAEGFANCFMRQNGFPGLDCSVIGTGSSCPALQNPFAQSDPRVWYTALNIQAINNFFTTWNQAVAQSVATAQGNVAQIVQIIDVPTNTYVILQDVLIALQSVLAIIPGPLGIWAAHTSYSATWQTAAQVFANAFFTVPNVGRYLFPTGTVASQFVQLATLESRFSGVIQQVQMNLNATLTSVMANVTEFLAFAEYGNFSDNAPSVPDDASYLYYAFNTYIISQALNGNNIYAVIARDTNVSDLVRNGTKMAYRIPDCEKGYNGQNVCDNFWYSSLYNSTFTLDNFSKMNQNYNQQLNALLSNYTTGPLLFEQAYECNAAGNYGQPVNITVNAGGINTACISQLRVLTWDMACLIPGQGECEFIEQPAQKTFGYVPNKKASQPQHAVPYGYLGPAIRKPDLLLLRS